MDFIKFFIYLTITIAFLPFALIILMLVIDATYTKFNKIMQH